MGQTDTNQPQTWTKRAVPYGHYTYWTVVCDSRYVAQSLSEDDCDRILADHAAAARLADALAEIESLRTERSSLIAEMNQRAVDARNDRQRLYEKVLEDVTDELEEFENQYRPVHEVGWEKRLHEAGRESIQKARSILTTRRERSKEKQ